MAAQAALAAAARLGLAAPRGLDLAAAGFWREPAVAVPRPTPRTDLVAALRTSLAASGALWLHGPAGFGRTTLATLLARGAGREGAGVWRTLELAGATPAQAAERLAAACDTAPDLAGVIVDDLDAAATHVRDLAQALRDRGAACVVISRDPPAPRLERAAGFAVHEVPSLDETEIGPLIAAYGGDPIAWTRFVHIAGGFGHPQLAAALVADLAQRGWPADEPARWASADLRPGDAEAERGQIRRRLLAALPPDAAALLARAAHVGGAFDRDLLLALAAVEPAVPQPAAVLDRLRGLWIESAGPRRLRVSAPVAEPACEALAAPDRRRLDTAIAAAVLGRPSPEPQLLDTAFAHAIAARSEALTLRVAQAVLSAAPDARPALAAAMPGLRRPSDAPPAFSPAAQAQLDIARLRLAAPAGDDAEVAAALQAALAAVDALAKAPDGPAQEARALSQILADPCAFGRLPGVFDLVTRYEKAAKAAGAEDLAAVATVFAAHAALAGGMAALDELFQALDAAPTALRRRRLKALLADPAALDLAVDGAWLGESRRRPLAGPDEAATFARLGDLAMGWGEPRVAARCFQAAAAMLDTFASDAPAALALLDAAERKVPGDTGLGLQRARAALGAGDHVRALDLLAALADRLAAAGGLGAVLALRDAGMCAAELGLWGDAAGWFARAAALAEPELAAALAVDAAAARFAGRERAAAVRDLAAALPNLAACNALGPVLRWIEATLDGEESGEPIRYIHGDASDPAAEPADPLSPDDAWRRLALAALRLDVPAAEVLAWPAVPPILARAPHGAELRVAVLEQAIRGRAPDLFAAHLMAGVEGLAARENPHVAPGDLIPPLPPEELAPGSLADTSVRDAVLAMGAALVLPAKAQADPASMDLPGLAAKAQAVLGYDPMPEWTGAAPREAQTWIEDIAQRLHRLGDAQDLIEVFTLHLRLFEWLRQGVWRRALEPIVAERVRRDWTAVLDTRIQDASQNASQAIPRLRAALAREPAGPNLGLGFVADVLLAAVPALSLDLWSDMLDTLRHTAANEP